MKYLKRKLLEHIETLKNLDDESKYRLYSNVIWWWILGLLFVIALIKIR